MRRGRGGTRIGRTLGAVCAAALLGAAATITATTATTAGLARLGPAPRAEDGRFLNLASDLRRAGFGVTFPFQLRRIWTNLVGRDGASERVPNDGAFLRGNALHSVPTATWVGHASLLIQMDGVTFLTDPIWSPSASPVGWVGPKRLVAPGLALEDLPPVDFVLISHNHYDHLDVRTLRDLAARDEKTRFVVPLGNGELLRENGIEAVDELDWGGRVRVGGVDVICLPAQHWSQRRLRDRRRALWSSWAVLGAGRRFYFSGDTGYFDGFTAIGRELGPFDLAAVAVGAYEPTAMMRSFHLDPEEAVRAARDLRAERALAVHWGTFDLADEPMDEPPRRFRAAALGAGYADEEVWVLKIGETREF